MTVSGAALLWRLLIPILPWMVLLSQPQLYTCSLNTCFDLELERSKKETELCITRTLHAYVDLLKATAKRARNPIEPLVAREAHEWIDYYLVPRKEVNTISRPKELTLPQDVTTILRTLFSVEHMAKFANMRGVINLALFITMAVHCNGRAGELILERPSRGDKCFHWRHVWMYAFPTSAGPTIKAKAQFKDLESSKPDPSKNKTFRLDFFPCNSP